MEKHKERIFTTDNLANKLTEYFKRGPFKNNRNLDICQSGDRVFTNLFGIEHQIWFEEERKAHEIAGQYSLRRNLCDFVIGSDSNILNKIYDYVSTRINGKRIGISEEHYKEFYRIFKDPAFSYLSLDYKGSNYSGTLIKTPMVRIPLGKGDHVSDNLFSYGFNIIILPAIRAANGMENVGKDNNGRDIWY